MGVNLKENKNKKKTGARVIQIQYLGIQANQEIV